MVVLLNATVQGFNPSDRSPDTFFTTIPPPCECHRCREQWRTTNDQDHRAQALPFFYPETMSHGAVVELLKGYRNAIVNDRSYLSSIMLDYGDHVLKSWRKKSPSERKKILQEAMPGIPLRKWYKEEELGVFAFHEGRSQIRTSLLLPYLSIEELSTDFWRLIFLLHLRTSFQPQDVSPVYKTQTAFAWCNDVFDVAYSGLVVSMRPDSYGQPQTFKMHEVHRCETMGFPRASIILEAQSTLLQMLRKVAGSLLAPTKDSSGSDRLLKFIETGLRQNGTVELTSPYLNQAFCNPPKMDIERLLEIAQVRMNITRDDAWLLQTDPAYFDAHLTDAMRNRTVIMGQLVAESNISHHDFLTAHGGQLLTYSIFRAAYWQGILAQCQSTKEVLTRETSTEAREQSLQELGDLLMQMIITKINSSLDLIHRLPDLHELVVTRYIPSVGRQLVIGGQGSNILETWQRIFREDPVLYAVSQLSQISIDNDEYRFEKIDFQLSRSMAIIDHHFQKSNKDIAPGVKTRKLDSRALDWLADFFALHEMLICLRSYRPAYPPSNKKWTPKDFEAWALTEQDVLFTVPEAKKLGQRLQEYRGLPVPSGRKDQVWLQRRDARLKALSGCWTAARILFERSILKESKTIERARLFFGAAQDPEQIRRVDEERKDILLRINEQAAEIETKKPWTSTAGDATATSTKSKKSKRKTAVQRSAATPEDLLDGVPGPQIVSDCDFTPKTFLSDEHVRTLQRLFPPPPGDTIKTGLITWQSFAKAMVDAGFSATHSGGSAVTFASEQGSIAIHRPHPEPKLDNVMLHIIGKRMNKHFGWTYGTFRTRDKDGKEQQQENKAHVDATG